MQESTISQVTDSTIQIASTTIDVAAVREYREDRSRHNGLTVGWTRVPPLAQSAH
jgi:hypothetical protein